MYQTKSSPGLSEGQTSFGAADYEDHREDLIDGLPEPLQNYVRDGTQIPGKSDRSHPDATVAATGINLGWSKADYVLVMSERTTDVEANKYLEREMRREGSGTAYLELTYDEVYDYCATHSAFSSVDDFRLRLEQAWIAIHRMAWPGQGGASELALLKAHFKISYRLGKPEYGGSLRELSELAHIATLTSVKNGCVRLEAKDLAFVVCLSPPGSRKTLKWRLNLDWLAGIDHHILTSGGVTDCSDLRQQATLAHDAFHQRSLGKQCGRVYEALKLEQGMSVEELVKALSVKKRSIVERLKRLEKHGLAKRLNEGWFRTERDLNQVAKKCGTLGKGAKLKELHQDQRDCME